MSSLCERIEAIAVSIRNAISSVGDELPLTHAGRYDFLLAIHLKVIGEDESGATWLDKCVGLIEWSISVLDEVHAIAQLHAIHVWNYRHVRSKNSASLSRAQTASRGAGEKSSDYYSDIIRSVIRAMQTAALLASKLGRLLPANALVLDA